MALCLRDHAGHFLSPLDTGSSARVPALSPRSEDAAGPSWAGAWPGRGSEGWAVPVLTGIWMEAGEVSGDGPGSWLEPGGELISFSPSTLCPRPPQPVSSPVAGARLTHHPGPRLAPQRPAARAAGELSRPVRPAGPAGRGAGSGGGRPCPAQTYLVPGPIAAAVLVTPAAWGPLRGAPPGGRSGKAPSLSAGEMRFTAFAEGVGLESNFIKRFILCHMQLP